MKKKNTTAKTKSLLRKGILCAAFAVAAIIPGALALPATATAASAEPNVVQAFGATAKKSPAYNDPYGSYWDAMQQEQRRELKNPQDRAAYTAFLAPFNQYKGQPLIELANSVNAAVQREITYTTSTDCTDAAEIATACKNGRYFLPSPIQTAMRREGDCIDQAILQYFIMRDLGVPVNRLFVANVSATDSTQGVDHSVLLLNTALAGQPQDFVVMNDSPGFVVYSTNYDNPNTLPEGWTKPYVFYDARNQAGFWASKHSNWKVGSRPAPAAKPALKRGLA